MNIEMADENKVAMRKKLMVNGEEIGFLEEMSWSHQCSKFHAALKLELENNVHKSSTLIQGYGPDPQAAIQNALDTGLEYHRQSLAAIEKLTEQLK